MIVIENVTINGRSFVRTRSDIGMMVERDGVLYDEAIDPPEFGREYTESETPVGGSDEVTAEDYQSALREMGVDL